MPFLSFRILQSSLLIAVLLIKPIIVAALSVPLTGLDADSSILVPPSNEPLRQDPDTPVGVGINEVGSYPLRGSNTTHITAGLSNKDVPSVTCFGTGVFRRQPLPNDCVETARRFKQDPYYGVNLTYTINAGRVGHGADRAMPLDYFSGSCLLLLSGKPETIDETFSLESQWSKISELIRKCIIEPEEGNRWGGFVGLATAQKVGGFTALIGSEPYVIS